MDGMLHARNLTTSRKVWSSAGMVAIEGKIDEVVMKCLLPMLPELHEQVFWFITARRGILVE